MMPIYPPTLVALMLVLILAGGCAGVQPAPRVLLHDTHMLVRLDVDTSIKGPDDPQQYTHPTEITVGQLETIFDAMRIQAQRLALQRRYKGDTPQHRVFEADEIATLAPRVKDAFSQASPMERVVFGLTTPTDAGIEATVGQMYIKDQHLHFILDCYRRPLDGDEFVSQCQAQVAPQGFELGFTQKDFFVGFGKPGILLGHSTKEMVIDFSQIHHSASSGS